jgi:hypothetical protein
MSSIKGILSPATAVKWDSRMSLLSRLMIDGLLEMDIAL